MAMTGLQRLAARGSKMSKGMRNDVAEAKTSQSQNPQNKDPEGVTPGPQYQQTTKASPVKMKLPAGLESDAHRTGAMVAHLAHGHHVKNADGSTSFHMHSLDGEPVSQDDVEPDDSMTAISEDGGGVQGPGDPYGISTGLKGLSM